MFATYQSSLKIAEAFQLSRVPGFDLVIADEAHRCAGRVSSNFATVLDSDALPARKRLFMTATPRYFTGRVVKEAKEADFEVASMDDETRFGPVLHRLGFAEAIDRGLLTDYQVVIVGVDDATYLDWAERGRFVTTDGTTVTDARTLAGQIGLAKAMRRYDLTRTISFHSRVSKAREFARSMPEVIDWMPARQRPTGRLWADYASGEMPAGSRATLLDHLRHLDDQERGLLANARCLAEGVDVPALDGVAFIDPRRSEVDIVQAVGRAIRLSENKTVGTIVIPVFIGSGDDPETALDSSAFRPVWDVIKALRSHDDALAEHLDERRRQLGQGRTRVPLPDKIHLDLPTRISADFADAFDTHLVEQTTANWEFWYGLLQTFVEKMGHARVPQGWSEGDHPLGTWVGNQRAFYRRGLLGDARTVRLEAIPGWSWDSRAAAWEVAYRQLCAFVASTGTALVPQDQVEDGFALGRWVNKQRIAYRRGTLNADRSRQLDQLPGWAWEVADERWESTFKLLTDYVTTQGNPYVPRDLRVNGVNLGLWVQNQRSRRKRLTKLQHQRLEGLPGWSWDPRQATWDRSYVALMAFVDREGHCEVPPDLIEEDIPVGRWVLKQRAAFRSGRLAADRRRRLDAIPGWRWLPHEEGWEQGLALLKEFARSTGHVVVPSNYRPGGFDLATWVERQRGLRRRDQLAADRAHRLDAIPKWTWGPRDARWEEGFASLAAWTGQYGYAAPPVKEEIDGFRLGHWVSTQRQFHKNGSLSTERAERLEALPGWVWDARKLPM